jgi:Flp pilus assembly protein TadB
MQLCDGPERGSGRGDERPPMIWTIFVVVLLVWLVGIILFESVNLLFHLILLAAAGILLAQLGTRNRRR